MPAPAPVHVPGTSAMGQAKNSSKLFAICSATPTKSWSKTWGGLSPGLKLKYPGNADLNSPVLPFGSARCQAFDDVKFELLCNSEVAPQKPVTIYFWSRVFGTKYLKPNIWYQWYLVPRTWYPKNLVASIWYHLLDAKFLVPSTWYQVLGIKYLVPSTVTKYLVPSAWYQIFFTTYLVPSTCYEVLGTKYLLPGTWYQILSTKYLVPGALY